MKRWASMLAVLALVAVGCGSSSSTGQNQSPKSGGTLNVALVGDIKYADPTFVTDPSSLYVADQVVQGLVGLAPGTISTVVPVLAAALPSISSDGLTYTFKLRSGIKFHDGTDFNAAAVQFNYERWKNLPGGDLQRGARNYAVAFGGFLISSNLASVDAPDDSTVVFHLTKPQSNFLLSQTVASFGIQSPTAIKANDGNDPKLTKNAYALGTNGQGKAMVGTGPFMFSEWKANDHITLVKNPHYWDSRGEPYLDRIVFTPFADSASGLAALKSGTVDLVAALDAAGVKALQGDSKREILDRGTGCSLTQLGMNGQPAGRPNVLADQNVRLAVASAVNRSSYISTFYAGEATVADNWLPAGSDYYKREYLPGYNITSAADYMARADMASGGVIVDLIYPTGAPTTLMPDPQGLAQAIAKDLDAVGFNIKLRGEPYATLLADVAGGKLPMWLQSQSCSWAGADNFLYTSLFGYVGGISNPTFNYTNDALNALMVQALTDIDSAETKTDWEKAEDMIRADMPTVPLLVAKIPVGAQKYVMGFVGAGNGTEVLNSVWLNK